MGKAKKSTGSGVRSDRPNGKAAKKNPGKQHHGSKGGRTSLGLQVMLGKGIYSYYEALDAEGRKQLASKSRKRKKDADEQV